MSISESNKKEECYLTTDAKIFVDTLVQRGMDKDLAIELLLHLCPEEEVYDLPKDH